MDINIIIVVIQFFSVILTFISIIILAKTIKNNINLNKNNLFNELVKQERELRIKLQEYKEEIWKKLDESKEHEETTLAYDTLLFNYYEYLSICLYKSLIDENGAKLYFGELLPDVRQLFENSILFKKEYAKKEQYKGIQWLFKKWNI